MPISGLNPTAPKYATCKCCGSQAALFGVVDFHKNCEEPNGLVLDLSGIAIYYHRCPRCGFIFTIAFDDLSQEDFARHIYNDEYRRVDPHFAEIRPRANAQWVTAQFGASKPSGILDYGAGNGRFAELLRESGFANVESYDPFTPQHAKRPEGKFECVFCFEVMEHSPRPAEMLADMASFLAGPGIIIFSTTPQPQTIDTEKVGWWYIAPRNGHISIFSTRSLQILTAAQHLKYGVFKQGFHIACNEVPGFFSYLIRR